MTNEEALYCLKNFKNGCTKCQFPEDTPCERYEAKRIAIEALEKQIQKKPIADNDGAHTKFICPFCECNYVNNKPFCDGCGQAIDWSEK